MYIYIHTYIYISLHIYIYIYVYIETISSGVPRSCSSCSVLKPLTWQKDRSDLGSTAFKLAEAVVKRAGYFAHMHPSIKAE